ncbi:hypothetical protein LCGC14_0409020 [marine sediment metagenome]|uniref:Uncharacterized protein n=1 Tax=marine sediment metagenome TaxID=412755 RepID=A0A0F9SUK6_9ZZZZ
MIVDDKHKQMLMEVRDINYILPAYVKSYLFVAKNEMPGKIIFPMFPSVTVNGTVIPIEYVPPLEQIAVEIGKDGADVAEVTVAQEAALDEKDDRIQNLEKQLADLTSTERGGEDGLGSTEEHPEALQEESSEPTLAPEDLLRQEQESEAEVSPARQAFSEPIVEPSAPVPHDRVPKQPPGGDLGPGSPLSDMGQRDSRDSIRTKQDLAETGGSEGDEEKEKEYEKTITRDDKGNPVVED